jgi:hypothetical protein
MDKNGRNVDLKRPEVNCGKLARISNLTEATYGCSEISKVLLMNHQSSMKI